jgi:signal transduction histidine kinase
MSERETQFAWIDLLWLVFLAGLAVLPPVREFHKQLILLIIGLFQISDQRVLASIPPSRRNVYSVAIKILLATLLIGHTATGSEPAIASPYYLIYFLPVVSAAMVFEAPGMLFWTACVAAAYCSYLFPALAEFQLTSEGQTELAMRVIFFFLAAVVVNRLATENRRHALRYQRLAETLAETNRQLERAQAEARRSERLAALGQLSAGLAHEIRNPLAVIKGSAEMLDKKAASADPLTKELAGYVSSEVNRLNALVSRFLDFARPSQLDLHPEDVTAIIGRALRSAHDRWPDARIELETKYAADLPPVLVDAALCEQVFTNLISNAYEAMLAEGGRLDVQVRTSEKGPEESSTNHGVIVELQDTGPGVPTDLREQIFNPFFTTKRTGVGLGLSIVSKIVDDHGGWIHVANGSHGGACFRLFLPAAEQNAPIAPQ